VQTDYFSKSNSNFYSGVTIIRRVMVCVTQADDGDDIDRYAVRKKLLMYPTKPVCTGSTGMSVIRRAILTP
jgi:hypothetical protein